MQEGDLVTGAARYFRSTGGVVLVARPNQTRVRFDLADGTSKAPDLIVCNCQVLWAFEAKVSSSALFRTDWRGTSDAEAMTELAQSPAAKLALASTLQAVMIRRGFLEVTEVRAGLLAADAFAADRGADFPDLLLARLDYGTGTVVATSGEPVDLTVIHPEA